MPNGDIDLTGWEPGEGGGGGAVETLSPGQWLKDGQGNWWRVYDIGGHQLRLAPMEEYGSQFPVAPKSQWILPAGNFETELGSLVGVDSRGRIIESRAIPWGSWTGSGGTTASAPAFASTQAGMERQAQLDLEAQIAADQAALDRIRLQERSADERQRVMLRAEAEMLEIRLDNSRRELAFGQGMMERRTRIQEKGAMGRELLKLGPDPFKQAVTLSGGIQRGITPQQTAVGQAQAFISEPLPEPSMNMSLPEMEQMLLSLQNMQAPTFNAFGLAPGGLAEGGVIEMENKDGAFTMKPNSEQTFLVGDGAGVIPGVTEVLTVGTNERGAFSVKVTPLAGVAQGGLELSTLQALAPLYEGLGFTSVPYATTNPYGGTTTTYAPGFEHGPSGSTALGFRPRLVRPIGSAGVYYVENGVLRPMSAEAFQQAGFLSSDIIDVLPETLSQYGTIGPPMTEAPPLGIPGQQPAFQALRSPLIEGTTGALLPAPFKQAQLLGQWQRERPDLFNLAMSAFGNVRDPVTGLPTGGLTQESVMAQVQAATPTGRFNRPQRIGFTGTRL